MPNKNRNCVTGITPVTCRINGNQTVVITSARFYPAVLEAAFSARKRIADHQPLLAGLIGSKHQHLARVFFR